MLFRKYFFKTFEVKICIRLIKIIMLNNRQLITINTKKYIPIATLPFIITLHILPGHITLLEMNLVLLCHIHVHLVNGMLILMLILMA